MGFFDIFKQKTEKGSEQPAVKQTQKPEISPNHISKKKKNTYVITFNVMADNTLFALCTTTPLPVIEINGVKQEASGGLIKGLKFPNPCANDMVRSHDILREIMGDRISATIIEYLDKDTGKPVVQVYPEGWYVFDNYSTDYITHLNHASRRDLKRQILRVNRCDNQENKNRHLPVFLFSCRSRDS